MKLIQRVLTITLVFILTISTITPALAVDTILGIPISKFDNVNKFKARLDKAIEDLDTYDNDYYKLKYKAEAYGYAYYTLELAELLGTETASVTDHISTYNASVRDPLTDKDMIDTNGVGDLFVIATSSDKFREKIYKLIGKPDDAFEDDPATLFGHLGLLRDEAGLSTAQGMSQTYKDSTLSEEDFLEYVANNMTRIRIVLTVAKDMIESFSTVLDYDTLTALQKYFADTYDIFVQYALEKDVEGLKDLDLFEDGDEVTFDPNKPESKEHIAVWDKESKDPKIDTLSEYMLKGIAVSATYEPFKTNLNSTGPFSFVGDQMQVFHETYGTKRKFILTPTGGNSHLNVGMDIEKTKKLKLMTLKDFIEDQSSDKVLYIDNMDYDVSDVKQAQDATKENIKTGEKKEDGEEVEVDNEDVSDLVDNSAESNSMWSFNLAKTQQNVLSYFNQSDMFDWMISDSMANGMSSQEDKAEAIIFAKGDFTGKGITNTVGKEVKEQIDKINLSTLVYTNIMEEYYNGTFNFANFKADLNKPMYVDIYGNILTASGYVVIPAMSNPFLMTTKDGLYTFTRAFIESYPEYKIEDGDTVVDRKDKAKKVIALYPGNAEQGTWDLGREQDTDLKDGDGKVDGINDKTQNLISDKKLNRFTTLIEGEYRGKDQDIDELNFYIADVGKEAKLNRLTVLKGLNLSSNKFDREYKLEKSLDLFSFPQKDDYPIRDYKDLPDAMKLLKPRERVAIINDYTVKLTVGEGASTEVVSFKDVPDSEEVKRFIYLGALAHVIKVEDGEILDKKILNSTLRTVTTQVYVNGVYGLDQLNNRLTDEVASIYEEYEKFLLNQSENRYTKVLGSNAKNNLLYNAPLEETEGMKTIIPVLYKMVLIIAITSIIILIIMSVFTRNNKFRQAVRAFTAIYLVMLLIQIGPWFYDNLVNRPIEALMSKDLISWTVVEQENNKNNIKLVSGENIESRDIERGSEIKLYRLDYSYPFKLIRGTSEGGNLDVDEYYETFVAGDAFSNQNNDMWVDGRYVVTDTNTLFSSSSIVVKDKEKDILQKMEHEVYRNPEISYYIPYYMFVDNIVYNLNLVSDLTRKIPKTLAYTDGTSSTTGRVKDYVSSALFLDYDEFQKRLDAYVGSDYIDTALAKDEVNAVVQQYGEYEDFLGIRKIILKDAKTTIAPFNDEQLENIKGTAWYPHLDFSKMNQRDIDRLQSKIENVNKKVKRFMLDLYPSSDLVADETLIKATALYASFQFNKEFGNYALNSYLPTGLSTKSITTERLMLALSIPREQMLDVTFKSYPTIVLDDMGYLGLMLSTFNDFTTIAINYIKPGMSIIIWLLTAIVVFTRKILLPAKENNSIMGSLKILTYYSVSSLAYGIVLWTIIRVTQWDLTPWLTHALLAITNILYLYVLGVLAVAMTRDVWNLGNAYILKGSDKSLGFVKAVTQGVLDSTAIGRQLMYGNANKRQGTIRLMDSLQGKLGRGLDSTTEELIKSSGRVSLRQSAIRSATLARETTGTGRRAIQTATESSKRIVAGKVMPKVKDTFNKYNSNEGKEPLIGTPETIKQFEEQQVQQTNTPVNTGQQSPPVSNPVFTRDKETREMRLKSGSRVKLNTAGSNQQTVSSVGTSNGPKVESAPLSGRVKTGGRK